jgi:hydroxyethylthiazole kinase-like uncharacterized protein yjeF
MFAPLPPPPLHTVQPLCRAADLRRIELAAADLPLMQRAGLAAAELAVTLCGDAGAAVLVLAGPGNNGGDAFEMARHLRRRFFEVALVFAGDPARLPADAAAALARFVAEGGQWLETVPPAPRWSLIVDGLFGIGLQRAVEGRHAALVDAANTLAGRDRCPLLALDCPSGLDADTGARRGATVRASHTITFIALKPGLLTADGPDHCGALTLATLGLDAEAAAAAGGQSIGQAQFAACLRPRARNSHKGSHGSAGILGGASGMVGAALLAGRAALGLGSGRVYLGLLDPHAPAVDGGQPELMLRRPDTLLASGLSALACGPGLGETPAARTLLASACAFDGPLVLDADALNLLAASNDLPDALRARAAPTLLTPHPAEAARLLGNDTATVQGDRIAAALALAGRFRALVVLKGCGSVVATPAGQWFVNDTGNPGLATAGSGDVLTGFVTALLAQGWPPLAALLAAVHLHGAAADVLAAEGHGPLGLTAGELTGSARHLLNRWIADAR